MSFSSQTYRVLIASPSDLSHERHAAMQAVIDWNVQHAADESVVLLPVRWETHASPELGSPPQEVINRQLVQDCDILVAMLWTRLGTPTTDAESGTVEEIKKFLAAGKPASLYISDRPITPDKIDINQLQRLRAFADDVHQHALVGSFRNVAELKRKLSHDLTHQVRRLQHAAKGTSPGQVAASTPRTPASNGQTLFAERAEHFRDEKEYIASCFVPMILNRCKAFVEAGKKVFLVVDSGTTTYPLFGHLGREAVAIRAHGEQHSWIDELVIVTNNLPGLESLMETGRVNPHDRYSPLAVSCYLLPGEPLPAHCAVTGETTNRALRSLHRANANAVFIGILTGNWIRLRRSQPACPLPLVRGVGLKQFKQIIINVSHEVWVVAPLGKVFVQRTLKQVNEALGFTQFNSSLDRLPYEEVRVDDRKAPFVKLVSTSRAPGMVLSQLSEWVADNLRVCGSSLDPLQIAGLDERCHLLFPFDRFPKEWKRQVEAEFPHSHTRREEFMENCFMVTRS